MTAGSLLWIYSMMQSRGRAASDRKAQQSKLQHPPGFQIKPQPSCTPGSKIPLSTWHFNKTGYRKWCHVSVSCFHVNEFPCSVCVCVSHTVISLPLAAVIALFCRQYDIIKDNDSSNNKEKVKPSSERSTPEHHSGGLLRSKVNV